MDTTRFEEWLLGQGLEDSTINNYRGKLIHVFRLCDEQGWDLEALQATQIRWIADQYPQTRSTLGQLKATLNHYYTMQGVTAPLGAIRLPTRGGVEDYKGLEDDDAERLEGVAHERDEDGLAVLLGLYLGLRRSEMVGLRWDDFSDDFAWVDVLGKGHKRRWLPVHPQVRDAFKPCAEWVFPGRFSGHAHHGTVYLWVQRVADCAGLGRVHPHALRHTCLTRLYEETGDVRLVQEFAGHSDPMTTARYTRVTRNRLADAISRLSYEAA